MRRVKIQQTLDASVKAATARRDGDVLATGKAAGDPLKIFTSMAAMGAARLKPGDDSTTATVLRLSPGAYAEAMMEALLKAGGQGLVNATATLGKKGFSGEEIGDAVPAMLRAAETGMASLDEMAKAFEDMGGVRAGSVDQQASELLTVALDRLVSAKDVNAAAEGQGTGSINRQNATVKDLEIQKTLNELRLFSDGAGVSISAAQLQASVEPAREAIKDAAKDFLASAVQLKAAADAQSLIYQKILDGLSKIGFGQGSYRTQEDRALGDYGQAVGAAQ